MDFMTTKDAVKKWNISERRIRKLLKDGRITGAIKIGNSWSIPVNASKPIDKRIIKIEDKPIEFNLDAKRLIEIENIKETVKQTNKNKVFLSYGSNSNWNRIIAAKPSIPRRRSVYPVARYTFLKPHASLSISTCSNQFS